MVQNRIRWCVAADLGLGAPAVLMLMGVHSMQSVSLLQPPLPPPLLLLLRRRLNSKQASTQSPAWSHPPKRIIWPVLHCVRLWRHRAEGEGCAAASTAASCVHWHCIGKTQHTHTHKRTNTISDAAMPSGTWLRRQQPSAVGVLAWNRISCANYQHGKTPLSHFAEDPPVQVWCVCKRSSLVTIAHTVWVLNRWQSDMGLKGPARPPKSTAWQSGDQAQHQHQHEHQHHQQHQQQHQHQHQSAPASASARPVI